MPGCCVDECKNSARKGFRLFRIPKNIRRQKIWLMFLKLDNIKTANNLRVCEVHFSQSQWNINEQGKKTLKYTATPDVLPQKQDNDDSKVEYIGNGIHNYMQLQQMSEGDYINPEKKEKLTGNQTQKKSPEKSIRNLKAEINTIKNTIQDIFTEDQLKFIEHGGSLKGFSWSDETLQKALKLYMACGTSGYEEILRQGLPYPSIRTIQRHIQDMKFRPGILHDVMKIMQPKVETMMDEERHASLLMDEMKIQPGYAYDIALGEIIGKPTIPNSSGEFDTYAEHALVFMLCGNCSRWKQTICFEFTGNSAQPGVIKDKIFEIIRLCVNINIRIDNITSDMGPLNKSVWKLLNINANRHSTIHNFIQHPCAESEKLFVMPDPCHVVKNLKNSLTDKHTFSFGKKTIAKYKLSHSTVSVNAVEELLVFDSQYDLKLAPYLSHGVLNPTAFEKMNVSLAFKFFNNDVAAAIDYLILKQVFPEAYHTTAWFIKLISKWFYVMSGRHFKVALSHANETVYTETIQFLSEFKDIICEMYVDGTSWKPFQTGLLLGTQTALDIQDLYLHTYNFKFVMLGRLMQDALENLFSSCRARNPRPNAKDFKSHIRLITLGQYSKLVNKSNYPESDIQFLLHFSRNYVSEDTDDFGSSEDKENEPFPISLSANVEISHNELNSLFHLLGSVIHKIKERHNHCDSCFLNLIADSHSSQAEVYGILLRLKTFKNNSLVVPTSFIFDIFVKIESLFRTNISILKVNHAYITALESQIFELNWDVGICHCSGVFKRLVNLYLRTRMYFVIKQCNINLTKKNVYSSYTMSKHNT